MSCVVWATGADSRNQTDISSNARGKVWGSDEVNVEGWKPLKRLPGHDSGAYQWPYSYLCYQHAFLDVTDVAWSPGDRYLASVGLDSTVIIWCGFTLGTLYFHVAIVQCLHMLRTYRPSKPAPGIRQGCVLGPSRRVPCHSVRR